MTVVDVNGNSSTCISTVTVLDLTPPEAICSDTTLYLNQAGMVSITDIDLDGGSTDNGIIASILASQTAFDCTDLGVVSDTLAVTDTGGNTDFCIAMVTVLDSISPMIMTCAIDTTENLNASCEFTMKDYTNQMLSSDNCTDTLDIVYTQLPAAGELFGGVGSVIPVTITGTDESGNFTICSFEVSLIDTIAPVIACPLDMIVDSDPGDCSAQIVVDQPVVTDNCDFTFTNDFTGTNNGTSLYPIDTTNVTWTAIDISGNASTCIQTIIVEDNEAPEIECSPDVSSNNDLGNCGAIVEYVDTEYSDNCTIDKLVLDAGLASGEYFEVGTTNVAYTVTDVYGNASSCSFNVEVIDAELPEILCPDNISTNDSIVIYEEPFFTDNCSSELALIDGYNSGEEFPHGYTTVTYLTTDPAGLTAECSFEVLVNHAPVAVNDAVSVSEVEYTEVIIPMANDYDQDGDDFNVVYVSSSVGLTMIMEDGTLFYIIQDEWCGTDSINYVIEDIYGASDTAVVHLDIACLADIVIPQVFTPNGDGVNDLFKIFGIYKYPNNKLEVYNRWGHRVFVKEGYNNTWTGKSEAELTIGNLDLPRGTYYYVLSLNDDLPIYKGFVFLTTNRQ
ncbi:MAG: gliding motility-associated-like protein [Glaciecola sp.]